MSHALPDDLALSPPGGLASLDAVLDRLNADLRPVTGEDTVPLDRALGRILARPVTARLAHPAFDASAMDGVCFALDALARAGDPQTGQRLPLAARIAAGHPLDHPLPKGQAARIFTGAALPEGADTVVMQEDCAFDTDAQGHETAVTLPPAASLSRGACVRPRGQDFAEGAAPLMPGRPLGPRDIAMAGACGAASLVVRAPLRVGVFSTGDEVLEPGAPPRPGALYNANRPGLLAATRALGLVAEDLGPLPDDPTVIRDRLAAAGHTCDVLLTSGGVSVGGEDHVIDVVRGLGALSLWRMAIKPGKPTALGRVGEALFIGLPGTPVSALVTFFLVARPILLRLAGATALPMRPRRLRLPAAFSYTKRHGRREFLRARLVAPPPDHPNPGNGPWLALHGGQEAHMLSSLVGADGLVEVMEDHKTIAPGDPVGFLPFSLLEGGWGGGA